MTHKKINILVYDNYYMEKLFLEFILKDRNNKRIDFSVNLDIIAEHKDTFLKKYIKIYSI